jgi:hypothetical protein
MEDVNGLKTPFLNRGHGRVNAENGQPPPER